MTEINSDKKLNVLHLIDSLDSSEISNLTFELSKQLKLSGNNVFIAGKTGILKYNLERANIPFFNIDFKSSNLIKTFSKLKKIIKKNDIKIIHTHSCRTAWFGYFLSRKTDIKLITEFNEFYNFKKYDFNKWLHSILIKSDLCIVPSNFMKTEVLNSYKTDETKIKIIPYSINLDFYNPSKITPAREMGFLQKYNIHLEKKLITIIDKIDIENGFNNLIKIAKDLDREDYSFIVASQNKPKDSRVKEYKTLIKNFGIEDKIAIIENMPDLLELLKTSHCYFSPETKAKAFNGQLLIANAMNRPCIATDIGANSEYINRKTSHLVEANDIDKLSEKIASVLDMPISEWEQLKEKSEPFTEKFSIKNSVSDYIKAYKSLLKI